MAAEDYVAHYVKQKVLIRRVHLLTIQIQID